MLLYGHHEHADDHLGLWTNPRLVQSVRRGKIEAPKQPSWMKNQAVIDAYDASPEIQRLNRRSTHETTAGEADRKDAA